MQVVGSTPTLGTTRFRFRILALRTKVGICHSVDEAEVGDLPGSAAVGAVGDRCGPDSGTGRGRGGGADGPISGLMTIVIKTPRKMAMRTSSTLRIGERFRADGRGSLQDAAGTRRRRHRCD